MNKHQIAAEAAHAFFVFRAKADQTEERLTEDIETAIEALWTV